MGKGLLNVGLDQVQFSDVLYGVVVGHDDVPVSVVEVDYVVSLGDATEKVSVGVHRPLVVDVVSEIVSLHRRVYYAGAVPLLAREFGLELNLV